MAHPELILTQSESARTKFSEMGLDVRFLSNGVDLDRFSPVAVEKKTALRKKYALDPSRQIILSVGHLMAVRNFQALVPLIQTGCQVIIAGSVYMGDNPQLVSQLEDAGIRVYVGYQPHVEELYQLADCYVFPPEPGDSISMPLSVLEAMACNLPVISTRFPGLIDAFGENNNVVFVDNMDDIVQQVEGIISNEYSPGTRELVKSFSWDAIGEQLHSYYQSIL